jgi:hypothetical protein
MKDVNDLLSGFFAIISVFLITCTHISNSFTHLWFCFLFSFFLGQSMTMDTFYAIFTKYDLIRSEHNDSDGVSLAIGNWTFTLFPPAL